MKKTGLHIDLFKLTPNAKAGIFVAKMEDKRIEEHDTFKPHRDNHCQLMLATGGRFKLNIDFKTTEFNTPTLLFVFPEQVHHIINMQYPKGWIITFDPSLINKALFHFIENQIDRPIALEPHSNLLQQSTTLVALMEKSQSGNTNKFTNQAIHALLNALLNLISAEISTGLTDQSQTKNRAIIITEAFSNLLKQHCKTWKQPSQYAAALALSVAHLNDTVKALTGHPVSVHIHEASILEAKRLLYFTDNSVKEVAHLVGYDEPVYFGKLFKKLTTFTPLEFRKQFRD